jgi:hypothetical protein
LNQKDLPKTKFNGYYYLNDEKLVGAVANQDGMNSND